MCQGDLVPGGLRRKENLARLDQIVLFLSQLRDIAIRMQFLDLLGQQSGLQVRNLQLVIQSNLLGCLLFE